MSIFYEALGKFFNKENLEKIKSYKVGIAGLGGLGSNLALNLVRCGFSEFVLCDFDEVDAGNLNRQFYFLDQIGLLKTEALKKNLLRINPDLGLKLFNCKIIKENAESIFKDCNIVAECLDMVSGKQVMAEVYSISDKFFVSVSGIAGWGRSDEIVTRKIHENFYIIGDFKLPVSDAKPPCSPRVNIAAAKQADLILSWSLGSR